MSFSLSRALVTLFIATFILSCETDIDIIAPKRDLTVVYGVLEANHTRHFIRINKLFVGEEAATKLASETGINEYTNAEMSAKILELNTDGGATGNEWTLVPTYIYDKDAGDFASDSNRVYYFDAALDVEKLYKIECRVQVEGEDSKLVTATTDLLGNKSSDGQGLEAIRLNKPRLSGNSGSQASDRTKDEVTIFNNNGYLSGYEVAWSATDGGSQYTTYWKLYYRDYNKSTGGLISKDSVTLSIGSRDFEGVEGQVTFPGVNTTDFYATIGRQVDDLDTVSAPTNVRRIVSDTIQFFLEIANEELSTYIKINQPVSDVVQDRPEYTNINNGIGIFGSRLITSTRTNSPLTNGRILDARSLEELLYCESDKSGDYTKSKSFTVPGRCVVSAASGPSCQ